MPFKVIISYLIYWTTVFLLIFYIIIYKYRRGLREGD